MKTNECVQKKKKNSKFKEAMEGRKDKKKEKKKKKKKLALDLDDSFIFACGSVAATPSAQAKPKASNLGSSTEKLKPQDSKKKTKRKKKVMFDLSHGYIRVKRPKFVSSSPQSLTESIISVNEAVRDGKRCSQVTETDQRQGQPYDNDSQCTGDEMNSQDLFITQKTFRESPSNTSSGEASDKAVPETPQMFTQSERELTECSHKANGNPKKENWSFQTCRELNTNISEEKDVSCPSHERPIVVNPHPGKPIVVNTSLDVAKSKKHSCTSSQQAFSCPPEAHEPSLLPLTSTASASTQTENFFTTELSSYLKFHQKHISKVRSEDLKPLDLSLPQRARKGLCCLSVKVSVTEPKDDEEKCGDQKPSCLLKEIKSDSGTRPPCCSEVKKEPCGQQLWSVRAKRRSDTTPSPQSQSEPKSADTTASSEDNEPLCRSSKVDLTQVTPHKICIYLGIWRFKQPGKTELYS